MMRYLILLMLHALLYGIPPFSFANPTVNFEPHVVKLNGIIRILKFPGPPNYENIKNGDADETGPYLILNNPIDINLVPNYQVGNDKPEKNVKLVQLVVNNDKDWKIIKEGNVVSVTGSLFSALTGHHHARVLLKLSNITILSHQKISSKKLDVTDEDYEFLKNEYLQSESD